MKIDIMGKFESIQHSAVKVVLGNCVSQIVANLECEKIYRPK